MQNKSTTKVDNKKLLPEKYYHTNYHHLLFIIESKYLGLLSDNELNYIENFKKLSNNAQCLYLRLQNRKGRYFRFSKLLYPEIEDIQQGLQELIKKAFVQIVKAPADEVMDVLQLYNRNELVDLIRYFEFSGKGLSKLNKLEVVELVSRTIPKERLWQVFKEEPVIKQNFTDEALMLQFLYFGSLDMDMSQFVIRDLGNLKFEEVDESRLTATFRTRKEAEDKLMLSLAYKYFRVFRNTEEAEDYFLLIQSWLKNTQELSLVAKPLYDRLVLRSGQFLEKAKLLDQALEIYSFTQKSPARERSVRILHKLGKTAEAIDLCQLIIKLPENAHEKYFAIDFLKKLEKGNKLLKSTTWFQKGGEEINIDKTWQNNVEMGILDWFEKQGMQGFFAENYVWRAIWGLMFWDIIFDESHTGLHHPFQRSPDDLFTENFILLRGGAINERLTLLHQPKDLKKYLKKVFKEKYGVANPIIGWFEELWPMIECVVNKVPMLRLEKTLLTMCQNLKDNSKGFPDLFIWDDTDYFFVEVKSPNDTLSAQQLFWLEQFAEEGIHAKLVNVKWKEEKISP